MNFRHGDGSPRLPVLACASRAVTPASSGGYGAILVKFAFDGALLPLERNKESYDQ
jgi:hypothetical protein